MPSRPQLVNYRIRPFADGPVPSVSEDGSGKVLERSVKSEIGFALTIAVEIPSFTVVSLPLGSSRQAQGHGQDNGQLL